MRTTLNLDKDLVAEAKLAARADGLTLSQFVDRALREALYRDATAKRRIVLPTFKGGGVMPGVDLNNSAAWLDLMDEQPGGLAYKIRADLRGGSWSRPE